MPTPSSGWDLVNNDFTGWGTFSLATVGSASGALVTIDGRSCAKLEATGDHDTNYCYIVCGSTWLTQTTIEMVFRNSDSSTDMGIAKFAPYTRNSNKIAYDTEFFYNTNYSPNPNIWATAGSDLTTSSLMQWVDFSNTTWHTIRMVINSSQVMYNFFDGQYLGQITNDGFVYTAYTPDTLGVMVWGDVGETRTLYVDAMRMSSTLAEPDCMGIMNINGETLNARMYSDGSLPYGNAADRVRFHAITQSSPQATYALPTVTTSDAYASKVRVKTKNDGVMSYQKYPTSF